MSFSRFLCAALAATFSLVLLTGCGQKGPLYLRDNPPPGTKIPKPSTPKPIPYPAEVVDPRKD